MVTQTSQFNNNMFYDSMPSGKPDVAVLGEMDDPGKSTQMDGNCRPGDTGSLGSRRMADISGRRWLGAFHGGVASSQRKELRMLYYGTFP